MKEITDAEYWALPVKERQSFTGKIHWSDGLIAFYKNSNLHRLDGPAIIFTDGEKEYCINNKFYTEQEYNRHPEVIKNSKEFQDVIKYKEMK